MQRIDKDNPIPRRINIALTKEQWAYASCNGMSRSDYARALIDSFLANSKKVPASLAKMQDKAYHRLNLTVNNTAFHRLNTIAAKQGMSLAPLVRALIELERQR
jgi:hypothetical protein